MDKQKFAEHCRKAGLPAEVLNGAVMLCYDKDKKEGQIEQFQKLAEEAGFHESMGWCAGKPGKGADGNG